MRFSGCSFSYYIICLQLTVHSLIYTQHKYVIPKSSWYKLLPPLLQMTSDFSSPKCTTIFPNAWVYQFSTIKNYATNLDNNQNSVSNEDPTLLYSIDIAPTKNNLPFRNTNGLDSPSTPYKGKITHAYNKDIRGLYPSDVQYPTHPFHHQRQSKPNKG